MDIRFLNKFGVPRAEVDAHQQIHTAFNRTAFAKRWRGYASFKLARPGRGTGDDDFDLVLVTHTQILIIELKNWRGKTLSAAKGRWFVDGRDMGPSPADTVNLKAKKLANVMRQKLGAHKTPFVAAIVVIQDGIAELDLADDRLSDSVLFLSELVKCSEDSEYQRWFPHFSRIDPTRYLTDYDAFFAGRDFRPKDYVIHGFRPGDVPIWEHPRRLFAEYRAAAVDSPDQCALLRRWDFSTLEPALIGEGDRAFIALREQRIFEYVAERNDDLSLSLLRPVFRSEERDVVVDFVELFKLPTRLSRLTEFAHSTLGKLETSERIVLAKVLTSRFAELHELNIAHRDLGQHSVWIERPGRVVLSGFPAAHYPGLQTIGAHSQHVRVGRDLVPEDSDSTLNGTPYQRDVFLLGVQCHLLLFQELPPRRDGVFEWAARAADPYGGRFNDVISKALARIPSERYTSAREMLNALNATAVETAPVAVDLAVFENFRSHSRAGDYPERSLIRDDDDCTFYRSSRDDKQVAVKIWHSVDPDARDQNACIRLLAFLEKARTIATAKASGLQPILDFGLTRRSLLLVTEWIEGLTLPQWLALAPDLPARLAVAERLLSAVALLHSRDVTHGDVHPENVVVDSHGCPVLIDALDFRRRGEDRYTTAYLPSNFRELSPFDRDRYGVAAVLVQILGGSSQAPTGAHALPTVAAELSRLLADTSSSALEPLHAAIAAAARPAPVLNTFTLDARKVTRQHFPVGPLLSDNGVFHVRVEQSQKLPGALFFRLTGVGVSVNLEYRPIEGDVPTLWVQAVPPWQLSRSQVDRDASAEVSISLADSDAPDGEPIRLVTFLLSIASVKRRADQKGLGRGSRETQRIADKSGVQPAAAKIGVAALWNGLLEAEEEAVTTLTVAGAPHVDMTGRRTLLVPFHLDSGEIEDPEDERVDVEHLHTDGIWRRCGYVEFEDTTVGNNALLAISDPDHRAHIKIGDKLRLRSGLARVSLTRRTDAVQRILKGNAVVGDLAAYFDAEAAAPVSTARYREPTDEDLELYTVGSRRLNPSQREAFRKVVGNGPISLVQGPPGTGKTWFIASLLHYLVVVQGARRVLVVSQSHEAVNNVLEKTVELFRLKGDLLDAVRLGGELVASEAIQHLHADSIERAFRETFKAERTARLVDLAAEIGLPRGYAEEITSMWTRLGTLRDRVHSLRQHVVANADSERPGIARPEALEDAFRNICADVYGVDQVTSLDAAISQIEIQLAQRYEVHSTDLIERLRRLHRLSNDWINSLGTPRSNFAEFLAKSRTVVADTLVGIGRRGSGVVQNEHDWVIVDEAARAASSELAVAMQAGRRILLVGDHRQLPPTYSDEVKATVRHRFDLPDDDEQVFTSEFERLYESAYGQAVGAYLSQQYRMAPAICRLVSSCFYSGQLVSERADLPPWYDRLPAHLNAEVTWVDTGTLGAPGLERDRGEGDLTNEGEAHVVMTLLRQIVESDGFMGPLQEALQPGEQAVGIVCMYARQRDLLDKLLFEATWLGDFRRLVKVDTVDGYQGKENRIVIVSTVRNNPNGRIGFLKSPNRINVAVSRAMDRLYVVGSASMWAKPGGTRPLDRVYSQIADMASSGGDTRLVSGKELLEWRR